MALSHGNGHVTFLKKYRNVLLISTAIFMSMIGFGMIFPLLPSLATTFGASKTEIGIVAAMFAFTRTLLVRTFGSLSDKVGRKPMMIWGFIGYSIFMSLFAFAQNIYWLYILRAAQGISSAAVWPAASALIADSVDDEDRGKAMGYMGMSTSLGIMFGPAFGGFLKDIYGIQIPFILCGLLTGFVAILIKIKINETVEKIEKEDDRADIGTNVKYYLYGWIFEDLHEILSNRYARTILGILIAGFIFNFAYALIEPLLPIYANETLGASATQVGLAFTVSGAIGAIIRPLAGDIADRFGRKKPMVIGSIYSGIFTIPLAYIATPMQMIASMGIRSVGWALTDPATLALLTDVGNKEKRGKIFGIYQLSTGTGWMLGPLIGGIFYDLNGAHTSFLITAAGTLIAGILLMITITEPKRSENNV